MSIWAIADLHLSFGVPNKEMDVFGSKWKNHFLEVEKAWKSSISDNDLVLLAGDLSWAKHPSEAKPDLDWIGQLPGTKVFIKGNHDYWWGSLKKVKEVLPTSCHLIQNDSFLWNDVAIGGARLWDVPNLSFAEIIDYKKNERARPISANDETPDALQIYQRELVRLEMSLKAMDSSAHTRIVMTHYPPIGLQFEQTDVSLLLEKYKIDICVFGHLHNVKEGLQLFGRHNSIDYYLTSCDYLNFKPIKLL